MAFYIGSGTFGYFEWTQLSPDFIWEIIQFLRITPFLLAQSAYITMLVRVFQREKTNGKNIHTERFILGNWLVQIMELTPKAVSWGNCFLLQGGLAFVPFRTWTDWMRFTHIREDHLLYSKSTNLNVNLIEKHPHRNIPGIPFNHISGHLDSATWKCNISHHNDTMSAFHFILQFALLLTVVSRSIKKKSSQWELTFNH